MTAPLLLAQGGEGAALDDALAAAGNRWHAHCLLELESGRVTAHHVQAGLVPDAVVAAVLSKSIVTLAQSTRGLRTLGLLPGGAVVAGALPTGESLISVPLGSSWTGCLWLVTREVTLDLQELARAADRVARAHLDGLDPLALDGTALRDCLSRGDALTQRLVGGAPKVRFLGLLGPSADPRALESALRRSGLPHLGSASLGDALIVVLPDNAGADAVVQRLLEALEKQGLPVRAALSAPVPTAGRTEGARDQVLACLPLASEGVLARVEEHRADLVLEQLRAPLQAAAGLVDDPLTALTQAASRDVDFRGSLLAWLEAHGDVAAAARDLDVHVNTLRYRVRRAFELLGSDLSDPSERLEIHLRLRLLP